MTDGLNFTEISMKNAWISSSRADGTGHEMMKFAKVVGAR